MSAPDVDVPVQGDDEDDVAAPTAGIDVPPAVGTDAYSDPLRATDGIDELEVIPEEATGGSAEPSTTGIRE